MARKSNLYWRLQSQSFFFSFASLLACMAHGKISEVMMISFAFFFPSFGSLSKRNVHNSCYINQSKFEDLNTFDLTKYRR